MAPISVSKIEKSLMTKGLVAYPCPLPL
ncbi:uncharacterized protein G2W53_032973 [Senna tora]|uniref:Uncharacterized protein n=1 Tax=Senna tora TaxID=362788 RepID=A0A834T1E2_9FABA|nr:uncharacterized protein G2W53_032973 [Senna tora]